MYGLYLNKDRRIVGAISSRFALNPDVEVKTLPPGYVCDYLYVNGEYVYSPETPEPVTALETVVDEIGNKYRPEIGTDGTIHLIQIESYTGELFE